MEELVDEGAERIGFDQRVDLVPELELGQDVLDVRREAIEVGGEVGLQLLLARFRGEVAQREGRDVVEGLAGHLLQGLVLVPDSVLVEKRLAGENRFLLRFKYRVKPANDRHRQDDVTVLSADINVPENVVGDSPNEVRDIQPAQEFPLLPQVPEGAAADAAP
nr:hypothetical protein [Rubritepida flocculans]